MSATGPLVSIIIPSYNRPDTVEGGVYSAISQTYDNIEILIVDDHSAIPVREALCDNLSSLECVRIFRHEVNKGASAARNTGIKHASGEYICFLDDDDRWHDTKIEKQISTFESRRDDTGVVYSFIEHIGPDGETKHIDDDRCEGDVTKALMYENCIGSFSTVMVRSDVVEQAGDLNVDLPSWQDREWYFRLSQYTRFQCTNSIEVKHYDRGGERISGDTSKLIEETVPQFLERIFAYYTPGRIERRRIVAKNYLNVSRYAIANGEYSTARRIILQSIGTFPFCRELFILVPTAIGGERVYRSARQIRMWLN